MGKCVGAKKEAEVVRNEGQRNWEPGKDREAKSNYRKPDNKHCKHPALRQGPERSL